MAASTGLRINGPWGTAPPRGPFLFGPDTCPLPPRGQALLTDLNKAIKVETSPMELDEQHGVRTASGEAVGNIAERNAEVEGAKLHYLTAGRGVCCQERSSSRVAFDA